MPVQTKLNAGGCEFANGIRCDEDVASGNVWTAMMIFPYPTANNYSLCQMYQKLFDFWG